MNAFLEFTLPEQKKDDVRISYSQYSMYETCPKKWELTYIKKAAPYEASIHTVFGTAFHETLQHYLTVMYQESAKAADNLPINKILRDNMYTEYRNAYGKMREHFSNKFELEEFYDDGVAILDWFKKRRGQYFSKKTEELLGIEMLIYHPVSNENSHVMMKGFLDIVIRNKKTGRITIIDIKTSTRGWNKYQKKDKAKISQLVLYKTYFADQTGISVDMIDIKYMIVKRKLIEGAMFPQKRVVDFIPASGKPTRNKLVRSINSFVSSCFNEDGTYNTERIYPAIAGKNGKNCKYCQFADNGMCPKADRIKE